MRFELGALGEREAALREEVRAFLREVLPADARPSLGMAAEYSPEFSRSLGARGFLGMGIPERYSGHAPRSLLERFVVTEEVLAAGAPVSAHWVGERQTAPMLLTYGTQEQRDLMLPGIARGELYFSVGMSEPDSGSDLASVRTRADKVDGGWIVNGTKIWTTYAHKTHYFVVLCRTSPLGEDRHAGLSQLMIDLGAPGLKANPIRVLDGSASFNEVVLEDVFVPDSMVLGELGMGWHQVTSELAHERAGPDRYLSTMSLLQRFLRELSTIDHAPAERALGTLVARARALREMSLSVACLIDAGKHPTVEAAFVKDLGTAFEQDVVDALQDLLEYSPDPKSASVFEQVLAEAVVLAPSFTIRGGTTEMLRVVAARSLRDGS